MTTIQFKEYVHNVHLKRKVALAVPIIAKTPCGQSPVDFVKKIQRVILTQWHEDDDHLNVDTLRLNVDRTILIQWQKNLGKLLSSLMNHRQNAPDSSTASLADSGYNSLETCHDDEETELPVPSLLSAYESPLNYSVDVKTFLNANMEFIRGVLRLEALIGEQIVIPAEKFHSVVREIRGSTRTDCEDVKIDSFEKPNSSVASAVVQYALQTTSTEVIVKKSVQEIQRYLCGVALRGAELPDMISNWEGSIVQHTFAVIRKLSDDKTHQKVVLKSTLGLAQVLITDMLRNSRIDRIVYRQYQCVLLLQLCGNIVVCSEVLHFLVGKIDLLSKEMLKSGVQQSESKTNLIDQTIKIEDYYYIFHLTDKLLVKYFELKKCDEKYENNLPNNCKEIKITDLWKVTLKTNAENKPKHVPGQLQRVSCKINQSWRDSLEKVAKLYFYHPLISIYAHRCIKTITTMKVEASP